MFGVVAVNYMLPAIVNAIVSRASVHVGNMFYFSNTTL